MVKELYKKYPFTSLMVGFTLTILVPSFFVGNDAVITNAIIQATWCSREDYICILRNYSICAGALMASGFIIDTIITLAKKRKESLINSIKNKNTLAPESKEDSKINDLSEGSEIIFHHLAVHKELTVENASPEQVIEYIQNSISATLWYLHINDRIAYDVDRGQTRFYDPQKDNTTFYGIVFAGIRYALEQREGGILNRKNGEKIPDLFTVSMSSAGLADKMKVLVEFNTQVQDAKGFFDIMRGELEKIFTIAQSRIKSQPNWNNIDFIEWNPRMNNTSAKCGIEVINNSENKISECYAELITLFEESNGEYINIYEEIKSHLPCLLAWQIHNDFIYRKTEIEKTDNRYLAISYDDGFPYIKGEKDFKHGWIPLGHIVAKIKVWGKVGAASLPAKILFVEMFSNGNRITTQAITDQLQKLPLILGKFSFYLDEQARDKNISGSGISFLNKVKIFPPFLGFTQSVFHPSLEQKLTEHFLNVEYINVYKDSIYRGESYTITNSDKSWEDISRKKYNSEEFASLLQKDNPDVHQIRTGMVISLPYLDKSNISLSSKDIKRKLDYAEYDFIEPTIQLIIEQFFLVQDEALELIKWVYGAAKKALTEK